MKIKKNKIILTSLFFLVSFSVFAGWIFVRADNENENEFFSAAVPKAIIPPTTTSKVQQTATGSIETKTITLNDSDGDGLLDKDDPHPTIPESYIVEDSNRNGIVDKFEK